MVFIDFDMHRTARSAKAGLRTIGSFVWPQRSIVTGERHAGHGAVAADDFTRLTFLNGGGCRTCAAPVETDLGAASQCAACIAHPPKWDQARAALAYDEASRQAILSLKHAGQRDGLAAMGNWMAMAGRDILSATDYLVPVPLHYQRLAKRGFNQSVWLAQSVRRHSGTDILVDALTRTRATPSQAGLTPRQRRKNVSGAFNSRPSRIPALEDATVTLIDDVYTTGSTLSACTKALKAAGAAQVNILMLARVVRGKDVTI